MAFVGGIDDRYQGHSGRLARVAGVHEHERRIASSGRLGTGTLACNRCDAPVALMTGPVSASASLTCPFCGQRGMVRDFLSLTVPTRPARVVVRVVETAEVRGP